MFGSVIMRTLMAASDRGEDLLRASAAWVDADESMVTTVDISGEIDPRSTPNFISNLTSANITGPEGELGISLTESAGTTASHLCRWNTPANLSAGYVDIRWRLRTFEATNQTHLGADSPIRWGTNVAAGADPPYINLPSPSRYTDETYTARNLSGSIATKAYESEITELGDGWRDIRLRCHMPGNASNNRWPGFRSSGSITGNGQKILELARLSYEQRRVSQITDVRDATVRVTQAANDNRQVFVSDLWLNSTACFVESVNDGTNKLTPATFSETPDTAFVVLKVANQSPTTAAPALRVGDITLTVGTDRQWHVVQGGSDTDTGIYIAAVPVCVTLRIDSGAADVFIDGALVGTASLTQGSTGCAIAGGMGLIAWKSAALFADALSDSDVLAVTRAMRRRAGLPARWPWVIWSGQSNGYDNANSYQTQGLMRDAIKSVPGWAVKEGNSEVSDTVWLNGAANEFHTIGAAKSNLAGGNSGWLSAAQAAHNPCAILLCARGGENATSWLEGGLMRDHTEAAVAEAVARFGTHLYYIDTWVWIQGESDAVSAPLAAAYGDNLEDIRSWLHATYGAQVKWAGVRLSTFVVSTYADTIRAAQDAFVAAHPEDVVYIVPTSDPADYTDALHRSLYARITVGQQLYAARMAA